MQINGFICITYLRTCLHSIRKEAAEIGYANKWIYLHNLSPHMSSQPITSRTYQRLLYLLTNQIAHQGF